ncbi:hypothetical protein N752_01785 [Desulforamulus aquiferis]|nr:hypothetical protein [Desulforamulus aquiferis]RYD06884.1 hypothetical protein N752_01785 [Desulforamulus aquiferis]
MAVVILNSNNRWNDATRLLDYGFNEVRPVVLAEKDELVTELEVREGLEKRVSLVALERLEVYVPRIEVEKIQRKVVLTPAPEAPVKRGDKLGKMKFYLDDKELGAVDLVANQDVDRLSWFKRLFDKS